MTVEAVSTPAAPVSIGVLGKDPFAERVCSTLRTAGVTPRRIQPEGDSWSPVETDWVILAGMSMGETVEWSEKLLGQGVGVAIETTGTLALRRSLGESWYGVECVRLDAARSLGLDQFVTRIRDVVAAAAAVAALSPGLLLIAALVKRSSPGPIFYSTTVVGRNGRTFLWRKIRTMRVGTPEDDRRRREQYREFVAAGSGGGVEVGSTKIVDVSRVTPIGRFLRRHSLDELPQLWNVLVGDMTLVGPRPCLPYEYELQVEWQRKRYRVTPGLTGPWQAYGRSKVSVDEMALIDYCYGHRRNFGLDLRIVAKTAQVVLHGEGGQ